MCLAYEIVWRINKYILSKINNIVEQYNEKSEVRAYVYGSEHIKCEVLSNHKEFRSDIKIQWSIGVSADLIFKIKYLYKDEKQEIEIIIPYDFLYGSAYISWGHYTKNVKINDVKADIDKSLSDVIDFIKDRINVYFRQITQAEKVVTNIKEDIIRKLNEILEVPIDKNKIDLYFDKFYYYPDGDIYASGCIRLYLSALNIAVNFLYKRKNASNTEELRLGRLEIYCDEDTSENLVKNLVVYDLVKNAFN